LDRLREKREGDWCAQNAWGGAPFIRSTGCCRGSRWRAWRRCSGLRRGEARTRSYSTRHGDHHGTRGAENGGRERAGDVVVLAVPWRRSSMMAMATWPGSERGGVWRLAGGVAMLLASAEGKGRTESTGRRRALQSPWAWPCRSWRAWTSLGMVWSSQCASLLGQQLARACPGE
jgi:hypothetical protein